MFTITTDNCPGTGKYFSACENSESNIYQECLDTQVIKSLFATQLVYPWIHFMSMLMCVSKMSEFLS